MNMNRVILIGRLVRPPEVRHAGDKKCATFSLAVNRWARGADGKNAQQADFVPCVAWDGDRRFTELLAQLDKGALMAVQGSLRQRSWEDKAGQKRSTLEVNITDVQLPPRPQSAVAAGQFKVGTRQEIAEEEIPF